MCGCGAAIPPFRYWSSEFRLCALGNWAFVCDVMAGGTGWTHNPGLVGSIVCWLAGSSLVGFCGNLSLRVVLFLIVYHVNMDGDRIDMVFASHDAR